MFELSLSRPFIFCSSVRYAMWKIHFANVGENMLRWESVIEIWVKLRWKSYFGLIYILLVGPWLCLSCKFWEWVLFLVSMWGSQSMLNRPHPLFFFFFFWGKDVYTWLSMRTHPKLRFGKILSLSIYLFFYMFDSIWLCLGHLIMFIVIHVCFSIFPCLFCNIFPFVFI